MGMILMDYFIDVMTLPHTVGGWVKNDDLFYLCSFNYPFFYGRMDFSSI